MFHVDQSLILLQLLPFRVWHRAKGLFQLAAAHSLLLSYTGNLQFYPAWTPSAAFLEWSSRDLTKTYSLIDNHELCSFQDLRDELHLPALEIFRYLQIQNFILSTLRTESGDLENMTQFDRKVSRTNMQGKLFPFICTSSLSRTPHPTPTM